MQQCTITEIDECARNISGCNQTCTNIMGSYNCSCDSGYSLGSDGHDCIGQYYYNMVCTR